MVSNKLLILLIVIQYKVFTLNDLSKSTENFGPYEIDFSEYENCKGPKSKDEAITTVELVKEGESFIGYTNMTFKTRAKITEIRLKTRQMQFSKIYYQKFQRKDTYNDFIKWRADKKIMVRITVYTMKAARKNVLWNYRMKEPCQHYAIAASIRNFLDSNSQCVVNKGFYAFQMNYSAYTKTFFGDSFFYGQYMLKAITLSEKGNIMCIILHPLFQKKP